MVKIIRGTARLETRAGLHYYGTGMRILLIDNVDSFTRNLEHLLVSAVDGAKVDVQTYARLAELDLETPDLIVVSPGPGAPEDYPGYERVFDGPTPVFGVCLGMQLMNAHRGGETGRLAGCVHGKTDVVRWKGEDEVVARYHSLHVTEVGEGLAVLASNAQGVPMCLASDDGHLFGVQFHPESFLTPNGARFIHDALESLGLG